MQTADINKKKIYFALLSGSTDIVDADGYKTGEKMKVYGLPIVMYANVSPSSGMADMMPFGVDLDYDRTMVTGDINCPIDEQSILWIGKKPSEGEHNFIVRKVARSINSITYALKEVKLS